MKDCSGTTRASVDIIEQMSDRTETTVDLPDLRDLPVDIRRHHLVHEVGLRLRLHSDLKAGDSVVVGASGGADSTALLLAMAALHQRERGGGAPAVRPVAVHVHHHLRDSADADAAFVNALCASLGMELQTLHVDPGQRAGNTSATARTMRYRALAEEATRLGSSLVAVAHHAEDQFETMLMAMCRGAGLDGLSGMPWVRTLKDDVQLIRPLLWARRSECEDLCRMAGVQWCSDPSNEDVTQARARVRQDVLPVLEELWPDATRRMSATSEIVRAAQWALEEQLRRSFGDPSNRTWPRGELSGLDAAVLGAGLREAALRAAPHVADKLGHRQLNDAALAIRSDDHERRQFDWPGGLALVIEKDAVRLERSQD